VVETDPAGLRWRLMSDMPFPFTAPNFAHGGAGVGYFMAEMYRATNDERYLTAAIGAANYVRSRTSEMGNGCLVCHTEELVPPMFYLGMCHGPVGTGRLFRLLGAITGDDSWAATERSLMHGLLSTGAPEQRSIGLWQNYGQCCGDAGIGDYCLAMFHATGEEVYLDVANRCAAYILSVSVAPGNGMRAWHQAEHRARPKFQQTQTGYMQGAAGIGSFLNHLATTHAGKPTKISFPDMPIL
jgi:lantibiotic modifying enzyme